jgi:AAA family ATP:ADP antiporter
MTLSDPRQSRALVLAMVSSGVVTAQFIAGKATRDAVYLAHLDVTTLPGMVVMTSAVSILLVFLSSKGLRRLTPGSFVPLSFVVSGLLLTISWVLLAAAPALAARMIYLLLSGLGPMLGSGFWLIASERFDPRTAKRHFGKVAGVGTLGGLAGGFLSERAAATLDLSTMLPILAVMNFGCAWLIRSLAASDRPRRTALPVDIAPELSSAPPRSGLRVLADAPYLRDLAALVLLGTAGAGLMDYVFKVRAVELLGNGQQLLRFFAIYYAAISLVTFLIQAAANQAVLERLGLAAGAGTPSLALLGGSAAALAVPGLGTAAVARGAESAFRGSLFRSSYEIFYTPIPPSEKRAAKSLIDVGFDRAGDALGGGLIRLALFAVPASTLTLVTALAGICAAAAIAVASRLQRGYIQTLERSLLDRALDVDVSDVSDMTTRTVMLNTLSSIQQKAQRADVASVPAPVRTSARPKASLAANLASQLDADLLQILALRSRDRDRVLRVLDSDVALPHALVAHVIPLLAWDPVAHEAVDALRRSAEDHIGELIDALINPNQEFAVRRRLARVFTVCVSQRATDGLILGLEDQRFEVRYQCARSLVAIIEKNPRVRIDREVIFNAVRREAAVSRPVWESHRLLNQLEEHEYFVDDFVKDRASRSLAHVFTLLALVLPPEPLRIAFRGLHTDDPNLRGTALEYLEGVLPPNIRDPLWPFLEDPRQKQGRSSRPRDEILADLLRSHNSIVLNLKELQQREGAAPSET